MTPAAPVPRGRVVLTGLVLAGLVALHVGLVALLPLPVAVPDVVIVAVLTLGLAHGGVAGGLAGLWAGLLLDLVPPAAGPLGGWMLVLGLGGAAAGRLAGTLRPGPLGAMAVVAAGTGVVVLARSAVLWFSGAVPAGSPVAVAAVSAALALLLAPLALLVTARDRPRPTAAVRTVPREVVVP